MKKLDHIAIAVPDLDAAERIWREALQLEWKGWEEVPEQKVLTSIFRAGVTRLELITPTAEDSPITGFLERRGPGLHHICFEVDDLEAEMERLKEQGIRLLNEAPRAGVGGSRVVFLHPKDTGGVLVEVMEKKKG
ncbi:MAG: methylmalonyl-CoA epimerase [Candidatus Zixiibacteriota bacterium]|nr:MAG: methylmalonyl-CoA epimerase [candidate division Zixibacteria bacterium]